MTASIQTKWQSTQFYFFAVIASLVLFYAAWIPLFQQWLLWEQVLSHGLPAFVIGLILLLYHPPLQSKATLQLNSLGLAALFCTTLAWTLFKLVNIDLLTFALLPMILGSLVWAVLGFTALLKFVPYLILTSLGIPIWGDLITPLVDMASWAVGSVVAHMGMTAYIDGSSITIPYGRLVIEDGCSGINYLSVAILLACILATLNDYRWRGWLAALALAAVLAILSNWVRITLLVVIGYQTEMESSLMRDHEFFGWVIFALFCLPALYFAPVNRRNAETQYFVPKWQAKFLLPALLISAAGPGIVLLNTGAITPQASWSIAELPSASQQRLPLPLNLPIELDHTLYSVPDTRVTVQLSQFQRSSSREKIVPYIGTQVENARWQIRRNTEAASDAQAPVRVYRDTVGFQQVVMLQFYQVGQYRTFDYRIAKLLQIPNALQRENRFALVTLQAPCSSAQCNNEIEQIISTWKDIELRNKSVLQ